MQWWMTVNITMLDLNKKLDGVGAVDNRPSTDYLHHFDQKRRRKKFHVTCDMCYMVGAEDSLKRGTLETLY